MSRNPEKRRRAFVLLLILVISSTPGCQALYRITHPALPACDVDLVPTHEMGEAFTARYRVHVSRRKIDERFTLVVELSGDRLALVGLDRFGAELFTLVQQGREIMLASPRRPDFRVPPENVLADLHRLRFRQDTEGVIRLGELVTVRSCGTVSTFALIQETSIANAHSERVNRSVATRPRG